MSLFTPMPSSRRTLPWPRNGGERASLARGFSLIELMVVVVVIAILAGVAYPNYRESTLKSRRGLAKADLVEIAQILERRHTVNNHYGGTVPVLADSAARRFYTFTPGTLASGAQAFTLTATPSGGQANDLCGTLTLTHTGQKGQSAGTAAECW